MRWLDFMRLRAGHRVAWIPTGQRGTVLKLEDRDLWVRWECGKVEKLHVEEDAHALTSESGRDRTREVSAVELQRRRMILCLAPPPGEDGSPAELERVWREAAEQRARRTCHTKLIRPSRIPIGAERRAER